MCISSCCGPAPVNTTTSVMSTQTTSQGAPAPVATNMGALGGASALGATPMWANLSDAELLGPKTVSATDFAGSTQSRTGKITFARGPEDRAKAAAILQRLMESTAKYQDPNVAMAAGYDFTKHKMEGDILHVSKSGQNLSLSDPAMMLYRQTSEGLKLIGVVLGSNYNAPDLGMGQWHVHGDGNINMMKHIWFTPDNLDQAYAETKPPA